MDETANGVREQLVQWFARDIAHTGKSPSEVADAILARWDLTEKPVVTDEALGSLIRKSLQDAWYYNVASSVSVGADVREGLERAGLTIVRSGEAK